MRIWQLFACASGVLTLMLAACSNRTTVTTTITVTDTLRETVTVTQEVVISPPVATTQAGIVRGSLLLDINFANSVEAQDVLSQLKQRGYADAFVQASGKSEFFIVFRNELDASQVQSVVGALQDTLGPLRVDMKDVIQPFRDEVRTDIERRGGVLIVYLADLATLSGKDAERQLDADVAVMAQRLEVFGIGNAAVLKMGADAILVEYPGGEQLASAGTLGLADILEFGELTAVANDPAIKWKNNLGNWKPATGMLNGKRVAFTSRYFEPNARAALSPLGQPTLNFKCNEDGSLLLGQITQRLRNKQLGIFSGDRALLGNDGQPIAPTVMAQITDLGIIEGLSTDEAVQIAELVNAGSMAIPVSLLFQASIEPINQ